MALPTASTSEPSGLRMRQRASLTVSPLYIFRLDTPGSYTIALEMRYTGGMPLAVHTSELVGFFTPFTTLLPAP